MPARTHHILVFDTNDTLILAGAYLKRKRHPAARILAPEDIENATAPIFDANKDPVPWKLHVIQHGSKGLGDFEGKTMAEVAELIIKSGLADQPKQTSDDRTCPVVRLDVCASGLPGSSAKSTVEQLAAALQTKLKSSASSSKTKVVLWGGRGNVIAPWTGRRGERMIGKDTKSADKGLTSEWDDAMDHYKTSVGVEFSYKLDAGVKAAKAKVPFSGTTLSPAETLLKKKLDKIREIELRCPTGLTLQAKAEVAWTLYQEAMQKFHEAVKSDPSLTIDKDARRVGAWKLASWLGRLLEGAEGYKERKETYLARAVAAR